MKVLWICNLILPEFSDFYNIKKSFFGGWMTGLFNVLKNDSDINISFAFPVYDIERRHDFETNGIRVYSFDGTMDSNDINDIHINEFINIIKKENPEIIHIWGTEYKHAYYAQCAACKLGLKNHVLIDIQGLTYYIYQHFLDGIPENVINDSRYKNNDKSLIREKERFFSKGKLEKIIIENAVYATGRTDWDLACVKSLNNNIIYFSNHRILRSCFKNASGKWNIRNSCKHRIFISNGSYPLKGFHAFIKTIEILASRYDDLEVMIAGPNPIINDPYNTRSQYGDYLENLIDQSGVSSHIHFIGLIDENTMVKELLKARVFVATSTVENSCNSLCEAMMLGVPSIASYSGGLPSLIDNSENGYLYQSNAPYMAAYYISKIFDDDSEARRLSFNASNVAYARHDEARILNNLLDIYERIIEK